MTFLSQISDALPGFVLSFVLRSSLLALLCAVALWLLRIRNVPFQHATWRLVLVAMLILPFGGVVVGPVLPIHLGIIPATVRQTLPITAKVSKVLGTAQNPAIEDRHSVAAQQATTHSNASTADSFQWRLTILMAYLLVTGLMLGRLVVGWVLMHRAARCFARMDDSRLSRSVNQQCENLGLLVFPEIRAAASVTVPMTFGWRRPTILLPDDWPEWSTKKLDLVLAHELSHIERGDYLVRMLSKINKALYWFHPLSWWLDKHLAELGEYLSDDAALQVCERPCEQYATILEHFAGLVVHLQNRFRLGIAMPVSAVGDRRINRILQEHRTLCSRLTFQQKCAVLGLGMPLLLVVIAGAQTVEQPSLPATPETAPTQAIPQSTPARRFRRPPPPLFSGAYVDALQGILQMEEQDAEALEQRLKDNPSDFAARLKLIAYCMRADRVGRPESRKQRAALVLWLVEHKPDSEILGSPYGVLSQDDLTTNQWEGAKRLWKLAATPSQSDARIFWNAANFYKQFDQRLYVAFLERAVALAADNESYARALGFLYAGAILTSDPQSMYRDPAGQNPELVQRAEQVLESTTNAQLLEPAVKLLQNEYNASLMRARENVPLGALARRYFERAKTLDPELDESWIYPKLDSKMIGMFRPGARPPETGGAQFEATPHAIRRLTPDAFPELPPSIKAVLRARGCLVPQPMLDGQPRNVIRGEFFEKGQAAWAVLCSVDGFSSILVFRGGSDLRPEELGRREDKTYLQGVGEGKIAYSREIHPVDRNFIVPHYRAYGGPEPPPIDHQGIDDAFLEKASVTHYWYRGRWLQLQGSD